MRWKLRWSATARRELASPDLPDPAELRARWPALRLHERRDLIGALIDCAFVLPSAVRYPVLKNGDNYSGARLAQNPLLVP